MSNVPAGVDGIYSHPGELLWWTAIQTSEVDLRKPNAELIPYGTGIQGWFVPDPVSTIPILADHRNYYQLNINPANDGETIPFVQQKGQVYWLGANLWAHDDGPNGGVYELGWKTSLTQYFDAAAYSGPTFMQEWNVLSDPVNGKLLDLAFVITSVPEPATLVLTVLGGLVAIVSRRRVSL
jgi:hypothetical protein